MQVQAAIVCLRFPQRPSCRHGSLTPVLGTMRCRPSYVPQHLTTYLRVYDQGAPCTLLTTKHGRQKGPAASMQHTRLRLREQPTTAFRHADSPLASAQAARLALDALR